LPEPVSPPPNLRAPDFSAPPALVESRVLEIKLAPARDGAGEIDHVEVSLRFSEPPGDFAENAPLVLTLPHHEGGEEGCPETIEDLYARDADGALTLKAERKLAPAGFLRMEWRSDRRPVGG